MAIQKTGRIQFQDLFEVIGAGSFTINFGDAATGSGTFSVAQITVAGAALGDMVLVGPGIDVIDAALVGAVTTADTVDIVLLNNSGAAINLGSADFPVVVLRLNPHYAIV